MTSATNLSVLDFTKNNPATIAGDHLQQINNTPPTKDILRNTLDATLAADITKGQMAFFPQNKDCIVFDDRMYGNEILDRIWINPTEIDFGNIISDQRVTIKLWNAKNTPLVISSLTTTASEGLQIEGDLSFPKTLPRNGEAEWVIKVTPQGSPTLDDTVIWNTNVRTLVVKVLGNRVIVYSLPPQQTIDEVLEFNTKVIKTLDSKEQRQRLRANPRHTISYTPISKDRETALAAAGFYGWGYRPFALPMWYDVTKWEGTIPAGTFSIDLDTRDRAFKVGGLCLLWKDANNFEAMVIKELTNSKITFDRPPNKDWENPFVLPLAFGYVDKQTRINRRLVGAGEHTVTFTMDDNLEIAKEQPYRTYLGYPLYERDLEMRSKQYAETYTQERDELDFGIVVPKYERKYENPSVTNELSVILRGYSEIQKFKKFINYLGGRHKPFYMITQRHDFELLEEMSDNSLIMRIAKIGFGTFYNKSTTRTKLAVKRKSNGVWYPVTVTNAITEVLSIGGKDVEVESLTLDNSLGWVANEFTIDRISLILPVRLDTDKVQLRWENLTEATIRVPVMEVEL